jgi:hypothetical protein
MPVAMILPLLLAPPVPATPLDRLVGDWRSVETVTARDGSQRAMRLTGRNRWVFPGRLLEISETYRVDGEKEDGRNHMVVRVRPDGGLALWWHTPERDEPLAFDGKADEKGMTFDQRGGRLRVAYVWDGPRAYDARLLRRKAEGDEYDVLTVARYTRR